MKTKHYVLLLVLVLLALLLPLLVSKAKAQTLAFTCDGKTGFCLPPAASCTNAKVTLWAGTELYSACETMDAIPDCPTRMKSAMKAMDEFVDVSGFVMVDSVSRSRADELREQANREDRRTAAIKQWREVKQTCWGKP